MLREDAELEWQAVEKKDRTLVDAKIVMLSSLSGLLCSLKNSNIDS